MKTLLYLSILTFTVTLTSCAEKKERPSLLKMIVDKTVKEIEKDKEAKRKEYLLDEKGAISANDLAVAFDANEIRANKQFKDSTFIVYGKIHEIGIDEFTDEPVVDLKGDSMFEIVECYFISADGLENFSIGDKVKITGTCMGADVFVQMVDCTDIENI